MNFSARYSIPIVWAFVLVFVLNPLNGLGQNAPDSVTYDNTDGLNIAEKRGFSIKSLIIPSVLIGYGVVALESDGLKEFNISIKQEIRKRHPNFRSQLDNYTLFLPAATVFGLQASGIKGKNNWKDEALIYAMSIGISTTLVTSVKDIAHIKRPDESNFLSFPSGHTSTAFASAEFLRREYWQVSPWIGVGGYMVAVGTGALRMYNNKHWFSDVVAGAGFGIASTTLSYLIYDYVLKKHNLTFSVAPVCSDKNFGFTVVNVF